MSSASSSSSARRGHLRDALEPIVTENTSTSVHVEAVSRAIFAPFQRKKQDSTHILAGLAPVLMTPKLVHAASSSSKPRSSLGPAGNRIDLAALGRAPLRLTMGTRRITSTDLQIAEATDELLAAEVPDEGPPSGVSLLRGFNATIPSSERGKARRRQMRNIEAPRMGLKKLGMNARGLLTEDDASGSEDDLVVVGRETKVTTRQKGKRRARESLSASVSFGKEELRRQKKEILLDKENIHVRRALINNEIAEVSHKIQALETVRMGLEEDLLKLKEDELALDDELEGVKERIDFEESMRGPRRDSSHGPHQSSRRRKGPAFLPSEHDELPPGVAFLTLSSHRSPITALDFSEPYGTLVSASSGADDDDTAPIVWDLLTVEEIGRLRGHVGTVKCMQVEEHVCLTGGDDGSVRVWDLRRVGVEGRRGRPREDDLISLGGISEERESEDGEESPEREEGGENGSVIRNAIEEGKEPDGSCSRVMKGHSKAVTTLFFEDNCLVTGASDKTLRQWDLATGQCILTMDILWAISHPHTTSTTPAFGASAYGAASSMGHFAVPTPPYQDGSWDMYQDFVGGVQFWGYALVSGSGDGAVRMWDMRTGQAHRTLLGHTAPVTCLQFDELHIASGSLDKTIRIWDLRTAGLYETLKFDHGVTALQFDSRKIVSTAGENSVKVYNRTTRQTNSLMVNGHTKPVERLRYMDRYLVSGGKDATVKIWAL